MITPTKLLHTFLGEKCWCCNSVRYILLNKTNFLLRHEKKNLFPSFSAVKLRFKGKNDKTLHNETIHCNLTWRAPITSCILQDDCFVLVAIIHFHFLYASKWEHTTSRCHTHCPIFAFSLGQICCCLTAHTNVVSAGSRKYLWGHTQKHHKQGCLLESGSQYTRGTTEVLHWDSYSNCINADNWFCKSKLH